MKTFTVIKYLLLPLLSLLELSQVYYAYNNAIDVLWDFDVDDDSEGWGRDVNNIKSHVDISVSNGNLYGYIRGDTMSQYGSSPSLDSPSLYLSISDRQHLAMRMMYSGSATKGRLLVKSGSNYTTINNTLNDDSTWQENVSPVGINDSGSYNASYLLKNAFDSDIDTFYLSNRAHGVYIIIDIKKYRWVNTINITPIGDDNSPKKCLIQRSMTSGVGPFETVREFTMTRSITTTVLNNGTSTIAEIPQAITVDPSSSRYWRVVVLTNYGGPHVGIREISFTGYTDDISSLEFPLRSSVPDDKSINGDMAIGSIYHMYYLPVYSIVNGLTVRIRMEFLYNSTNNFFTRPNTKYYRESFALDYIGLVKAPEILFVKGCLEMYSNSRAFDDINYNVTSQIELVNGFLSIYYFIKNPTANYTYAMTYDCPLSGGIPITVGGYNFGPYANVFINGNTCPITSRVLSATIGGIDYINCILPAGNTSGFVYVRIENGELSGLYHTVAYLSYRVRPIAPLIAPKVSNIASHKVDLSWSPSGDEYNQLTITGYKLIWYQPNYPSRVNNCTVGNVTKTSIRGLYPNTTYVFAFAVMSEGAYPHSAANLPTDLYGRRNPLSDMFLSDFSPITNLKTTLEYDISFDIFNANHTLNNSYIYTDLTSDLGPTGSYGSEGSYGLILVGDTNIQNCNISSTCCDGYNASIGYLSCYTGYASVCAVLPERMLAYEYVIDGITRRDIPTNLQYSNGKPASKSIITISDLISNEGALLPSVACGPSLRLTSSVARLSGSTWYRRKMNVFEGFDTTFSFQISNPSLRCSQLEDVNTLCRSRGADGFAFVIQNTSPTALGLAGSGLGYEGIHNSLAIEIDTFYNYENVDFYENHIGVMTKVRLSYWSITMPLAWTISM